MPQRLLSRIGGVIRKSHCGMPPESRVEPMTSVLRARDAHMALVMARYRSTARLDGAVLIVGMGHV